MIKQNSPSFGARVARSPQHIAFASPRAAHQEAFIEGVLKYAREQQRDWQYLIVPEQLSLSLLQLSDWDGDGVIAALNTPDEAVCAADFHLPVVNISSALLKSPVPRCNVDNYAIGEMAAEHLLERGFQNFAFYGMQDIEFSDCRRKGFERCLLGIDYSIETFIASATFQLPRTSWRQQWQALADWIADLPLPCGVFAVSDVRARQIVEACNYLGIKIPDQIAVIGVDDQRVVCELNTPTISSVARNNVDEGYAAASMLDRMVRSRSRGDARSNVQDQLIRPLRVVTRESTATFAVSDQRLRAVLAYCRHRICDNVTVDDLCDHVGVSRRWLEYTFRQELDESPYQYIRRQKLELGRRLLTDEPTSKIKLIAKRTGFTSAKQFTKCFRREFGVSPREFKSVNGVAPITLVGQSNSQGLRTWALGESRTTKC